MSFNLKTTLAIAALALGTTLAASAQANTFELAAGGGLASFHEDGNSSNKGQFTASAAYNAVSNLAIGFEYAYMPIQSLKQTAISGGTFFTLNANEHLNSFGGVARFGLTHEHIVQPYVLFAGGGIRDTASAAASGGVTASASASATGGYFGFGAGVNSRLGRGWGFRPEVRYQRVSVSGSSFNDINLTFNLFYTFGGHHHKHR